MGPLQQNKIVYKIHCRLGRFIHAILTEWQCIEYIRVSQMTTDMLQLSSCPLFIEWDLPNCINFRFGKFMIKKRRVQDVQQICFPARTHDLSLILGVICVAQPMFLCCVLLMNLRSLSVLLLQWRCRYIFDISVWIYLLYLSLHSVELVNGTHVNV